MKRSRDSGEQISAAADTDSSCPIELPARRGFSISYQGRTLLSRIDPAGQAERLAAEIPVKERTLYFCPSPLYGYGLSLFLEKLPKNSALLCVEADEKLFEISQKALKDLITSAAANEGIRSLALTQASDEASLCAFVRETWGQRRFRRVEEIRLGGGWQLFPRLYEDLAVALRREMAVEWGNAMTLIRLGRLYARNLIRNLSLLPGGKNIQSLNFGCTPVLVLGAGPSMDSLLDRLPAGDRRFKIICADTCIPALHERSIVPDLAVILESQHWNLRDFSGACGRKINAAMDLSALPASGRVLGGEHFFFATPWTNLALFKRLDEAGLLPETFVPLGSVGLSAVALALRISSGPVLIGGIDLSYTLDAYHARSTAGHGDQERKQTRLKSIINAGAAFQEGTFAALSKNGEQVRSDPGMRNYRNLFEQEFGGNPNANSRLLDISGCGLPLGIKTVSLAGAFAVLNREAEPASAAGHTDFQSAAQLTDLPPGEKKEKIAAFIRGEIDTLNFLLKTLSGEGPADPAFLDKLLDTADYLWAHFPECAGAGGRRPAAEDIGFLKRVRLEIDPFLKLWNLTLGELKESQKKAF